MTTTDTAHDQDFLQYVIESIVDQTDQITITRTIDDLGVLLELSVATDDVGKVIGKSGNTIKALRTLLRACGSKHGNLRVNLRFIEDK